MSLKVRVGTRIREIRRTRGLTQEALAERTDRSVDAISAMERGIMLPGFETLDMLARALKVPLADFFDSEMEPVSKERERLWIKLVTTARSLSDTDLEIAVEQVAALAKRRGI